MLLPHLLGVVEAGGFADCAEADATGNKSATSTATLISILFMFDFISFILSHRQV